MAVVDHPSASARQFEARSLTIFQSQDGKKASIDVRTPWTWGRVYDWNPTYSSNDRALQSFLWDVDVPADHDSSELDRVLDSSSIALMVRLTSNSNSRLCPSRALFDACMKRFAISSRLLAFVMCYGFKKHEFDYAPPTPAVRKFDSRSGGAENASNAVLQQTFPGIECVYGYRYAVKTTSRQQGEHRWAVRQSTIYQRFEPRAQQDIWLLIGPSEESERCINSHLMARRQRDSSLSDILSQILMVHATLVEDSMADWRWYLADLSEQVRAHADKVLLADIGDAESMSDAMRVDFGDSQTLKLLEDAVLNLQTTLEGTQRTIIKLRNRLVSFAEDWVPQAAEDLNAALTDLEEDASLHLMKAKVLLERVKGAASLLTDLLSYENGSALKTIAEESRKDNEQMRELTLKATKDSEAIKVITIITVFFLPATVVASFFSTSFIDINAADEFNISGSIWIYFAVTVPLTVVTGIIWYLGVYGSFRHRLSAKVTHRRPRKPLSSIPSLVEQDTKQQSRALRSTTTSWLRLSRLVAIRDTRLHEKASRHDVEDALPQRGRTVSL